MRAHVVVHPLSPTPSAAAAAAVAAAYAAAAAATAKSATGVTGGAWAQTILILTLWNVQLFSKILEVVQRSIGLLELL